MRFAIFPDYVALAGKPVYSAFVDYINNNTPHTCNIADYSADCAIIWSVLWHGRMEHNYFVYKEFKRLGKPIIILEVGSLKRNTTWRVSINHIDNTGFYGNKTLLDMNRPSELKLKLDPWRENIQHKDIIICGQHDKSELWKGMPYQVDWVLNVAKNLRLELDNKIIFRPHPRCMPKDITRLIENDIDVAAPNKVTGSYDDFDFDQALDNASLVYTHTSNAGITAAIKGVPIYCSDNGLAREVRVKSNNVRPDRDDWFLKLCHTEWTLEEIKLGIPFKRLEKYFKH